MGSGTIFGFSERAMPDPIVLTTYREVYSFCTTGNAVVYSALNSRPVKNRMLSAKEPVTRRPQCSVMAGAVQLLKSFCIHDSPREQLEIEIARPIQLFHVEGVAAGAQPGPWSCAYISLLPAASL